MREIADYPVLTTPPPYYKPTRRTGSATRRFRISCTSSRATIISDCAGQVDGPPSSPETGSVGIRDREQARHLIA